MPIHEMPMRWADLDQLNHVNNVVYVDYATEARAAHEAAGELEPRTAASVSVEFLRPLLLSRDPVVVESTDDGERLVQEVRSGDREAVFARVTTTHGEPQEHEVRTSAEEPYPLRVRRSDLGPDGTATLTKLFEYSQESRIIVFNRMLNQGIAGRFVVARVDLHPGEPIGWQADPYPVHTEVARVGTSSVTLASRFAGGRHGVAEAVLVGYDLEAQRSRRLTDEERTLLDPTWTSS